MVVSNVSPQRSLWRRTARRLIWLFLTMSLLFVLASGFFAYRLTDPHSRPVGSPPTDFPFPIEEATWETSDNKTIRGWLVPATNSDRAIVLLHGQGGDRRSMLPRAKFFRQHGYNVLLYDARACGESSGDYVTMGFLEARDLEAGLKWLRAKGMRRVACLGVSQGGATILLAAEKLGDVRCVVCESVYDELAHAVDRRFRLYFGIPGWLGGCLVIPIAEYRTGVKMDEVKPVKGITRLSCPVFIISGDQDTRTRPEDTERLFDAAVQPKELWMVPGAGHNDLYGADYESKVLEFLEKYMK
jgi:dipeptidyl aminopeptidase/acylaminoacyl peptidase